MKHDIDAVYFGDDWGQQRGLITGKPGLGTSSSPGPARPHVRRRACWAGNQVPDDPFLRRRRRAVRRPGRSLGVNCFNPFQPEVMDVAELMGRFRGRLTFFGGLSTQKTLPYGSVEDVRAETRRLIELGRPGGYILSPAHAVESDVPLENMLAFIQVAQSQIE